MFTQEETTFSLAAIHCSTALLFFTFILFQCEQNTLLSSLSNGNCNEEASQPCSSEKCSLVLNCSGLTFFDYTGVSTLVELYLDCKSRSVDVFLANCTASLIKAMTYYGDLDTEKPIFFDSVPAAISIIQSNKNLSKASDHSEVWDPCVEVHASSLAAAPKRPDPGILHTFWCIYSVSLSKNDMTWQLHSHWPRLADLLFFLIFLNKQIHLVISYRHQYAFSFSLLNSKHAFISCYESILYGIISFLL